ncbi:MAG: hypothetical protein JXX29_00360 [Deltaproteobacteria bacterium]|nr:hypothetical protein [Deltaproteobacteria bacterium]MBN2670088.1 hypothetical protein [Deltaproteobacteria bacterium]
MKKLVLGLLGFCIAPAVLGGCAASPEEYSTEHNPEYEITYLLTDFEINSNRNAEAAFRNVDPMGWHYMYDDSKTLDDYVEPHAQQSEMCRDLETDVPLIPTPPECDIMTGYQVNAQNPFTEFGSQMSFHWSGTAKINGVGFGTYFADYSFNPIYTAANPNILVRDGQGRLPATFSNGRKLSNGTPFCKDNGDFAGRIHHCYYDTDASDDLACIQSGKVCNTMAEDNDENCCCLARQPFLDRFTYDQKGKYLVDGSIYTQGAIYTDTDGMEHFELAYEHQSTMKEPRCLGDLGQEGFVMWATGDADLEVQLLVQETAPLTDGGICDEAGGEKCYDHPTVVFELDDQWREYHASWDEFVQEGWGKPVILDPNKIINIQLKVNGPKWGGTTEFDIWMDQMGFYGGTKWEFVKALSDSDNQ